jgi:hypothetical protein
VQVFEEDQCRPSEQAEKGVKGAVALGKVVERGAQVVPGTRLVEAVSEPLHKALALDQRHWRSLRPAKLAGGSTMLDNMVPLGRTARLPTCSIF